MTKQKEFSKTYKIKRRVYYSFIRILRFIQNSFFSQKQNKFLFILSPPYCGSTLLNQLISTSKNVSCNNLLGTREGQLLPGVEHFMFQKSRWDETVDYPWELVKKVWLKYWDRRKPILLDKSIPNIMRVPSIRTQFNPIYFICMVRNPYAQIEGLIRRNKSSVQEATLFTLRCLQLQKQNIEKEANLLFFTYEQLCDQPDEILQQIVRFIPEISDINIHSKFSAHNFKTKGSMKIVNLNQEKINKLSDEAIKQINQILEPEKELLAYFGYQIIHR